MDFGGRTIGNETYVAPNATLAGDVHLGDNVTILFGAVLRADMDSITIGDGSNVQDNAVIHESVGKPVVIGKNVSIGHGAIIHGAKIADNCLIGMGAIVLNDAKIGEGSLIAAGALVSERNPAAVFSHGSPRKSRPGTDRRGGCRKHQKCTDLCQCRREVSA